MVPLYILPDISPAQVRIAQVIYNEQVLGKIFLCLRVHITGRNLHESAGLRCNAQDASRICRYAKGSAFPCKPQEFIRDDGEYQEGLYTMLLGKY